ncbi:hypothetical protein BLOT_006166 [Blomia tropicalis]|nr:hypothetical protein BLOT_006166 [Blomia tropicalis]
MFSHCEPIECIVWAKSQPMLTSLHLVTLSLPTDNCGQSTSRSPGQCQSSSSFVHHPTFAPFSVQVVDIAMGNGSNVISSSSETCFTAVTIRQQQQQQQQQQ